MTLFQASLLGGILTALTVLPSWSDEFIVHTHPTPNADVEIFMGPPDVHSAANLCILSGDTLLVTDPEGDEARTETIQFPKGTSAFDLVEGDTPNTSTVYFVAGNGVYRQSISAKGVHAAELLFREESLLSHAVEGPRPYVLVVSWEGRPLLALPTASALKLFDFDGTLVKVFPSEAPSVSEVRPFSAWVVSPPVANDAGQSFRADTTYDYRVQVPDELSGGTLQGSEWRGTYAQAREATHSPQERWPWFSLHETRPDLGRVLYAVSPGNRADTHIRISRPGTPGALGGDEARKISPARTYPGLLVIPSKTLPDFNGDGYTDLLMWNVPVPGTSVDSLVRTAQQRSWPVRLTVHTYSPAKGLYSGRPLARLEARVPVSWAFMSGGQLPVRNLLLGDMNGDGHTDLGFSSGPTQYALWLYEPGRGFAAQADYTAELPERIRKLSLYRDASQTGKPYLVLRGDHAVYVLRVP